MKTSKKAEKTEKTEKKVTSRKTGKPKKGGKIRRVVASTIQGVKKGYRIVLWVSIVVAAIALVTLAILTQTHDLFGLRVTLGPHQEGLDGRIVSGEFGTKEQSEGIVSLQRGYHYCGGTIVSDKWVVTAAHCFGPKSRFPNEFPECNSLSGTEKAKCYTKKLWNMEPAEREELQKRVIGSVVANEKVHFDAADITSSVGSYFSSSQEGTVSSIKNVVYPEFYNEFTLEGDIALVELATPATTVTPMKMNGTENNYVDNKELRISGWGRTGSDEKTTTRLKTQLVNIFGEDWESCYRHTTLPGPNDYQRAKIPGIHVTGSNICAGGKNSRKGVCSGDSGGPLFISDADGPNTLVGITSFGPSTCGTPNIPDGFTNVKIYKDWIQAYINGEAVPPEPELPEPSSTNIFDRMSKDTKLMIAAGVSAVALATISFSAGKLRGTAKSKLADA